MKTSRNILVVVALLAALTVLDGCSAGADSLLEADLSLKILPKVRGYGGKDAEKVERQAIANTTARDAMDKKVITTSAELDATLAGF